MRWAAPGGVLVGVGIGYAVLQLLGRRSGSTAAERARFLPGDDLVRDPTIRTDHARTIRAPASRIWPWLTQMGWHRGGYYTPAWVDRLLFPGNQPSLDHLDEALVRELRPGDTIPDGPPGTAEYVVTLVDAPRLLVLRSDSHLPPGFAERWDAAIDWTWTFTLTPVGDGATRLHVRVTGRLEPRWLLWAYQAVIVPADAVMASGMLRGISRRVEAASRVQDGDAKIGADTCRGGPPCRPPARDWS